MSSDATLARPYARAAFELAQAGNALSEWSRNIAVSGALAADDRVLALLLDPRRTGPEALELLLPADAEKAGRFADFLRELANNQRLPVLPEIARQFESLKRDAEGTVKARVRSAVALDAAQLDAMKSALARRLGRDVEIETAIDPALIGGAVIEAGETVIDGSVRGRLERLAREIVH